MLIHATVASVVEVVGGTIKAEIRVVFLRNDGNPRFSFADRV